MLLQIVPHVALPMPAELVGRMLGEVQLALLRHLVQRYPDNRIIVPEGQGQPPLAQIVKNEHLLTLFDI